MKYVIKNYQLIPEEEAVMPVTHREYFFNFSIYESLKVIQGKVYFVDEYIERLMNSAKVVGIEHSFSKSDLINSFNKLIEKNNTENGLLRVQLIGGENPTLFVFTVGITFYPKKFYREGIKVVTYNGERYLPEAKSNCLLLNYVAYRKAQEQKALDALLVDKDGFALEGTRSNLFVIKGNKLITTNEQVLEGVTRKHILLAAKELGLNIVFEKILIEDILEKKYDEVFISSTSMGAMPVREVNEVNVSTSTEKTNLINKKVKQMYKRGK